MTAAAKTTTGMTGPGRVAPNAPPRAGFCLPGNEQRPTFDGRAIVRKKNKKKKTRNAMPIGRLRIPNLCSMLARNHSYERKEL